MNRFTMKGEPDGGWYYEQVELVYNDGMISFEYEPGASQLGRLDDFIARRRALAVRYDAAFAEIEITRPWQDPDGASAFHLYVIRVRPGKDRRAIYESLHNEGRA